MIKLLILDTNEKLNINKNTESFTKLAEKVAEESKELIEALLLSTDLEHIMEETLDLSQLTAGLADRICSSKGLSLEKQVNLHNLKLIGRGWEIKKTFEIRQI